MMNRDMFILEDILILSNEILKDFESAIVVGIGNLGDSTWVAVKSNTIVESEAGS